MVRVADAPKGAPLRVIVQALTAAPGGSARMLRTLLSGWPAEDDLLVVTWRPEVAAEFAGLGREVLTIGAGSTASAFWRTATTRRRSIASWDPDVVYSQQYLLPGLDVPQALHHRNLLRFQPHGRAPSIEQLRDHAGLAALRKADANIFNSEVLLEAALARWPSVSMRRPVVVHNAVELDLYSAQKTDGTDGRARILVPQSDVPHKRNDLAIEVLSVLHQDHAGTPSSRAQLIFAGTGNYRSAAAHASRRGVAGDVVFMGYLPSGRLAGLYASADVVLVTSSTESFCNPIVEAHAAGIPIITGRLPVAEELRGPLSYVASDDHPSTLALAVSEALSRGRPSPRLLDAAHDHAAAFSPGRQANGLRRVLHNLVQEG